MSKKEPAKAIITDLFEARQKAEIENLMLDFQKKDELSIPTDEAQASIRTDMEFSVAETKYILECLHTLKGISEEQFQLSETDDGAEAGRLAAEELGAVIAEVEKAKALSKDGKYVIPMTFWEMDAFLSVFELEREMFEFWTKAELRQRRRYVEVVMDIDERFKPLYNQRRAAVMPIFARAPAEAESDDFDFQSIPPIESELDEEIDIELALADTRSILSCLKQAMKIDEELAKLDCGDDGEADDSLIESAEIYLELIAKIKAAKSSCMSVTYTVRLTFWELDNFLGALQGEIEMMEDRTEAEIRRRKKYFDTINAVIELLQPVYRARDMAIWPNGQYVKPNASAIDPTEK